ncbi:MAG: 3-hydroxyisobutyrate dehydrogenase [Pseudonocardiales bacterium]|jgi:3-hydroxyisobutyrate dehydrogenase-like beta-hydroxyacid dehydrogenase|nr:3-hydroxyisobutyrate dehydrogenase [Pseudonocardiales bacterium]
MSTNTPIGKDDGVAVIGLGKMGLPMARNLRTAGYRVVGFDVSAAQLAKAAELGIETATTPADAARRSATALVVVGFDDQATEVVAAPETGILAGASAGYIVAMCSTVESTTAIALGELCEKAGAVLVDATLCLGEPAAEDASMLIMCGGDDAALDRIDPVLATIGKDIYRLGGVGAGQIGKMLNNYLLWNSVVANYEALRLGGRLGLDLEALRQSLMLSSGNNWALETWLRSRPMPWAEKDMRIVMQHADDAALPLPNAGLVREEIKAIKVVKNAWTEGGGSKASMNEFTRAHL